MELEERSVDDLFELSKRICDVAKSKLKAEKEAEKEKLRTEREVEKEKLRTEREAENDPYKYWDLMSNKYNFLTMSDTDELYFYYNGIYQNNGEAVVKKYVQWVSNKNESKVKRKHVSEVIDIVKRNTLIERDELDSEKYKSLICLENGVFDLKTFKFCDHDPEYKITVKIPIVYNPDADCPKIKKFVKEIVVPKDRWDNMTNDDEAKIKTIFQMFGYCLYRGYDIKVILMLLGDKDTGKSTLIQLYNRFVGYENVVNIPLQTFNERFNAKAELYNKMINSYPDLSSKMVEDTGLINALTGGDRIYAEKKGKDPFYFTNYAKLIYGFNVAPSINEDAPDAFYERIVLITCPNRFPVSKIIFELEAEKPGLLNVALEHLKILLENGEFAYQESPDSIKCHFPVKARNGRKMYDDDEVIIPENKKNKYGFTPKKI